MYIDPNTGGMLFQVLATILALFSGILLLFSGKIRSWMARLRRSARRDENNKSEISAVSSPEGTPKNRDDESIGRD